MNSFLRSCWPARVSSVGYTEANPEHLVCCPRYPARLMKNHNSAVHFRVDYPSLPMPPLVGWQRPNNNYLLSRRLDGFGFVSEQAARS